MDWNRSTTLGLAKPGCTHCNGYGQRPGPGAAPVPCNCVFRAIFRACYARFRECVARQGNLGTVTLDFCGGRDGHRMFSRKNEEYIVDFCRIAERLLDPSEYQIFRFHFLLGATWRLVCRQLKMERGDFFHTVYRIEQKLGRQFCELQPYALFPLDEYFAGRIEVVSARPTEPEPVEALRRKWRPPLLKAA